MQYSYLVVDNDEGNAKDTLEWLDEFPDFYCIGTVFTDSDAVDKILETQPQLVFLTIDSKSKSNFPFFVITELYRYINVLPYFIVLADTQNFAYEAIKHGVFDYLQKPFTSPAFIKCLYRFKKQVLWPQYDNKQSVKPINTEREKKALLNEEADYARNTAEVQKSEVDIQICIKSYGDYQFIALRDVVYLQADNNTTDFHLQNGKKLTAYKTLKHYENNLPSFFYRIHNSYIVNSNYVSRINTGKSLCYLDNNEISVSFSKTFKDNVETIIRQIAPEYL
ncbi:DNA-binding response regulator [Flavobacterium sp. Sd200]|uniref:LytR/AlgR family response regulator transcription factor n=1 Tax=Flavobacterium sp. Sd200 TaxID=2692211 RepID=UPI0013713F21|nr:DNA-binding response regulator [Flavobacterium sp. Sd200]